MFVYGEERRAGCRSGEDYRFAGNAEGWSEVSSGDNSGAPFEIYQINEAYEWVDTTIKESLKKDFQGAEEDIAKMQQMMEESNIGPKKKDAWLAFGIALCVIFANEVDGMEWRTLVDGNREAPILLNTSTGEWIDPMKLVWSKVKAGGKVNLPEIYSSLF